MLAVYCEQQWEGVVRARSRGAAVAEEHGGCCMHQRPQHVKQSGEREARRLHAVRPAAQTATALLRG